MTSQDTASRRFRARLSDLVSLVGRKLHYVRADSLYHLAAYHLRDRCVSGVVDGGAYIGHHALTLARIFPRAMVYAFEPTPESYASLVQNVKGMRRIVPESLALADKTGSAILNINRLSSTNSFLATATGEDAEAILAGRGDRIRQVTVKTVSLAEYVQQKGVTVDLLKLDLQGAEVAALRGARAVLDTQCRAVISEVRFRPAYVGDVNFHDVDAYLAGYGFRLACLAEVTHHPGDSTLFEANALWLRALQVDAHAVNRGIQAE